MDKQLLKAYIKTIVEDEVKKILPELLAEAVAEIKQAKPTSVTGAVKNSAPSNKKPPVDRKKLAEILQLPNDDSYEEYPTVRASTKDIIIPEEFVGTPDPDVLSFINKDYSGMMKSLGITKE